MPGLLGWFSRRWGGGGDAGGGGVTYIFDVRI